MIGTKLGPYEITAKLGEGGMGEVYRAHDTKLKRDVAIKVLPAAFTEDKERLARFEREAHLLASLNHPNVAGIYGLEESEGTRALVMELVEGPTLAERLEHGPLPFNESLSVSLQIAQALEEAHEKGIVHRDLKPQNIKASIEGRTKVLDFGLAKAMDPAAGSAASAADLARSPTLMQSPTLTAAHGTQLGVILGTAAYMAPEQARGVAVDKRADIWAFGVVLYEMLTGRRLFEGELVTDVLANVLKKEVDFGALPLEVPAAIRRLLRRCLERNPKNRLHDIADARIVLEELAAGRSDDAGGASLAATPPPAPHWRRALPWAVAGAALAWGAWVTLAPARKERVAAAPGVAFTVPWRTDESTAGLLRSVTMSRDGRRLVIWDSFADRLLLRDLDGFSTRALPGTEGAGNPFLSPDGEWLAFNAGGALKKVALAGGDPVKLCDAPSDNPGGSWEADGFLYYTPSWSSGIWRVSENGGTPERVTEPDRAKGESLHLWPSLLPDRRSALFTLFGGTGLRDAKIALVDLATGDVEVLAPGSGGQYVASGQIVFFRHGSWFAVPFDASSRKLAGGERRVLAAARPLSPVGSRERTLSFSDDGRLAYIAAPTSFFVPHTTLAWIDREGRIEPLPFEGQHSYNALELSPDGRRASVTVATEGEVQVWVYDLERGARDRLTRDGLNLNGRWHPDGSRLAVTTLLRGNFDLRLVRADALAAPTELVASPTDDNDVSWSPDGRTFVYEHGSEETGIDIWTRGVDETGPGRPLVATADDDTRPRLSPDGRWLLVQTEGSVYVTGFPAGGERIQLLAAGGLGAWSPTTPEIFAVADGKVVAIRYEVAGGRFRPLETKPLFDAPRLPILGDFAVAPDARRFLFFVPVPGKTLEPELRVVTDGFAELGEAKVRP